MHFIRKITGNYQIVCRFTISPKSGIDTVRFLKKKLSIKRQQQSLNQLRMPNDQIDSRNLTSVKRSEYRTKHLSIKKTHKDKLPVSLSKKALEAHYSSLENLRPTSGVSSSLKPHLITPSLMGRPPISNISAKAKLKTIVAPAVISQK